MSRFSMPRLLLSAAHKSSGKTTIAIGLCAALRARGLAIQPYKKGPDYIDPMWLSLASGRACRNLDPHLMGWDEIARLYARASADADASLIEANKGLYDGLALDGSDSNAALARHLALPVVLVLDAQGMTRGIAPLLLGYQAFDRNVVIAGVILNNVGGSRHEAKLRAVLEHYTEVPVLGAVQRQPELEIVERHLGLVPANEAADARLRVAQIGRTVGAQVDLDALLAIARGATPLRIPPLPRRADIGDCPPKTAVRIGLARDAAFGFYYADDLERMEAEGANIVVVDTLNDAHLPKLDGLFIGGGFPESFIDELAANASLRGELRTAIEAGLPVYAECGGLMYLARSIYWRGKRGEMVGALPVDTVVGERPVGRGYVEFSESRAHPWARARGEDAPTRVRAHEFHYSSLRGIPEGTTFALEMSRGHGIDGHRDGIVHRNVVASYVHRRSVGGDDWAARFVAFVRSVAGRRSAAHETCTTDGEALMA